MSMFHIKSEKDQGRIHGQYVVACGWAGPVMQMGRGSMWVGRGSAGARQRLSCSEIIISVDFYWFLVADTQLYKRLCRSIRRSVRGSSAGPSVEVIESKSGKMSVLDTFYVCLCMEWGLGFGWGLHAPAHPSATIS